MRPIAASCLAALALAVPSASAAPPARWSSETGWCHAGFILHTFWHDVEGTTTSVTAILQSEGGDPLKDGAVEVSVDAASLDTGIARRDRKMSEEHLETSKHPRMTFQSTAPPRRTGNAPSGSVHLMVEGDLTLHGVTRRVAATVEATSLPDGWLMRGGLTVSLAEYSIPDPSIALNHVRDEVDVTFEIRFVRLPG